MTERLRFFVALLFVSLGAACFAVVFRSSLGLLYRGLYRADNVVEAFERLRPLARMMVPIGAAAIAGAIAALRKPTAQGVSNVMEALALGRVQLSMRSTVSRVLSSWVSIAGGLSIGREGPLIEFGGTLGASVARLAHVSLDRTRVLIAAGTAAGFAAAYNTPLASALFVVETLVGIAAPAVLLPTVFSVVVSTAVSRMLVGAGPIYGNRAFAMSTYRELAWFAALGGIAAVVAGAFKITLRVFEELAERHPMPQPARAMCGGLVVGLLALYIPEVVGNGYEPLNTMLDAGVPLAAAGVLLVAKIVATSGSVAGGIPGGIFTPTLLVGAALGTLFAHVSGALSASAPDVGSFALVGMAAATAASIHAPLTAAVMIFELSGDYLIVLPLLIATIAATAISRGLGSESVYETELRRKGLAWDLTFEGRRVRTDRAS